MLGPPLTARFTGAGAVVAEGWWSRTVLGPSVIVPDGAVDLMWMFGRPPWIAGPDTTAHTVVLRPGSTVVGVRLRPGVTNVLTAASVETIADSSVGFASLLSSAQERSLEEQLECAMGEGAIAAALVGTVVDAMPTRWLPDPLLADVIASLRSASGVPGDLTLSPRQLRRRFANAMGYGPKFYERIIRLGRFTDLADVDARSSLGVLAARSGYFDQSHLVRDCQLLTGRTPTEMAGRS